MNQIAPMPKNPVGEVADQPTTLAAVIIDRIRAGASLEETQQYYKFLREIQADEAKLAFDADFVQLQLPEIPKLGRINIGAGKAQQYVRMEDINDKIGPVLNEHGFKLRFDIVEETDTSVTIEAILVHRRGHSISTRKKLPLDKSGSKNIVQAYGSTQSYAQRYAAIALLNLTSRGEDDDGAGGRNGNGHLSDEQLEAIQSLIVQTNSNIKLFCNFFKIENVSELPAKRFAEAQSMLKRKLAP